MAYIYDEKTGEFRESGGSSYSRRTTNTSSSSNNSGGSSNNGGCLNGGCLSGIIDGLLDLFDGCLDGCGSIIFWGIVIYLVIRFVLT